MLSWAQAFPQYRSLLASEDLDSDVDYDDDYDEPKILAVLPGEHSFAVSQIKRCCNGPGCD